MNRRIQLDEHKIAKLKNEYYDSIEPIIKQLSRIMMHVPFSLSLHNDGSIERIDMPTEAQETEIKQCKEMISCEQEKLTKRLGA